MAPARFDATVEVIDIDDEATPPTQLRCADCNEIFGSSADQLEAHITVEHLKWVPFECMYCHVYKPTKASLITHLQKYHPKQQVKVLMLPEPDKERQLLDKLLRALDNGKQSAAAAPFPFALPFAENQRASRAPQTSNQTVEDGRRNKRPLSADRDAAQTPRKRQKRDSTSCVARPRPAPVETVSLDDDAEPAVDPSPPVIAEEADEPAPETVEDIEKRIDDEFLPLAACRQNEEAAPALDQSEASERPADVDQSNASIAAEQSDGVVVNESVCVDQSQSAISVVADESSEIGDELTESIDEQPEDDGDQSTELAAGQSAGVVGVAPKSPNVARKAPPPSRGRSGKFKAATRRASKGARIECADCDKWFRTDGALLTHANNMHAATKKRVVEPAAGPSLWCQECKLGFSTDAAHEKHRRHHTNGDDFHVFECRVRGCQLNFDTKYKWQQHAKKKHGPTSRDSQHK